MAGADPNGWELESPGSFLAPMHGTAGGLLMGAEHLHMAFPSVWASHSLATDSKGLSQEKLPESKHCQSRRLHGLF